MMLEAESEVVLKIWGLRLRNFCFIRRVTEGYEAGQGLRKVTLVCMWQIGCSGQGQSQKRQGAGGCSTPGEL